MTGKQPALLQLLFAALTCLGLQLLFLPALPVRFCGTQGVHFSLCP